MPGVPSGRGCEACRKQKKKCDQARPKCSRCTRLQIPCVGAGQQRYKFHNQTLTGSGSRAESWSAATIPASEARASAVELSPPSSDMTMTTSQLVSALEVLDPRFDLTVYGGFFRLIPQRLGNNKALDTAVEAVTTTLPMVQSRHQQSPQSYGKYTAALEALRVCLGDPANALSVDTMCALYLIVVCQGWMGNLDDPQPSHGEAIAHMLGKIQWRMTDKFETDMLNTLCVAVILESFVNPRINLDPELWGLPETFGPRSPTDAQSTMDSLRNRNLARVTTLIRDPVTHLQEIEITYHRVREDSAKMARILAEIPVVQAADGRLTTPLPIPSRRLHMRWQTGYGILLLVAIMLNKILRFYRSTSNGSSLREESSEFVDSIIVLAEQASQYRPLGASASSVFLLAAYAALDIGDEEKATRIQALLEEYQSDFSRTRNVTLDERLRLRLQTLQPHFSSTSPVCPRTDHTEPNDLELMRQNSPNKADLCCIL